MAGEYEGGAGGDKIKADGSQVSRGADGSAPLLFENISDIWIFARP